MVHHPLMASLTKVLAIVLMATAITACGGGGGGGGSDGGGGGSDGGGGGGGVADTTPPSVSSSPAGGVFSSSQSVTLSNSEGGAIYYTTDGSSPTTASTLYIGSVPVATTTTLKYFGKDAAGNASSVISETYTIDPTSAVVTPSVEAGAIAGTQFVSLNSSKPGTVYYTLDGSTPTGSSKVYYGPVRINPSATTTLSFLAKDSTGTLGPVGSATYVAGNALTDVSIINTGGVTQTSVPVSFGQVFAPGDVPAGGSVTGRLSDNSALALQVDHKATHADGSLRHAVISAVLPSLGSGATEVLSLVPSAPAGNPPATPAALIAAGFSASVQLTTSPDGKTYTADVVPALGSGGYVQWLQGSVVNEWIVKVPLLDSSLSPHPHLIARFAVRSYSGLSRAKVDVTIENNWAYEPSPQSFTYLVDVSVGGASVYSNSSLTHYHHARWRKTFWWNGQPSLHIKHNSKYLIESKALPHYESSLAVSTAALSDLATRWSAANKEPMGNGLVMAYFPTTGGRPDIGPLPQWAAEYLLSMDETSKSATLGVGTLAGSFSIHYRDRFTDRPVSLVDHPKMTLLGNPIDAGADAFPTCVVGGCSTPYMADDAHQPSLAYLPYLVTGDQFFLEELQFWANWNMFRQNPNYRDFAKGLVKSAQVRAQAWSLRTLGQVAFITPDADPLKAYFVDRVKFNIDYYHQNYIITSRNSMGYLDGSGANEFKPFVYDVKDVTVGAATGTGLPSWQDDFFTWAIGYLVDLGFTSGQQLFAWKSAFSVGRMTAAGYCWTDGSVYNFRIRENSTSAFYSTFADAYLGMKRNADGSPLKLANGALFLDQPCATQAQADWRTQYDKERAVNRPAWLKGEMVGTSVSVIGFPSNMQPAVAIAVSSGIQNAGVAWDIFSRRDAKPNYSDSPQWAIVPWNQ